MSAATQQQMLHHQQSVPIMTMAGNNHLLTLGQQTHSMGQMVTPQTAPMMMLQGNNALEQI
ncbi:hypothetical protein Ciccas_006228 [Cichlidogyrus casuarinus]|uniref:Uncharacterized protein n=1 Tax=Cichlidogyrus casuarinus TaxID=1844966 RepID=A0ABD2Q6D3_9PLAT